MKNVREDSPGRCSDGSSKGSLSCQRYTRDGMMHYENEEDKVTTGESAISCQDEAARRRELALRQHAFFQLRLHIRRGANLVAMDRCGKRVQGLFLFVPSPIFGSLLFFLFFLLSVTCFSSTISFFNCACATNNENSKFLEVEQTRLFLFFGKLWIFWSL